MMVNHDVTDRMENIPDEKFTIIGIDKDAEAPTRPRVGYWRDAWRRLKENKVAFAALIILLILDLGGVFATVETIIVWIALGLTVISLVDYLVKNKGVLLEGDI